MEPLSVRLLDFIRNHPGVSGDRVISNVVDYRHEKASDAERILLVLERSGKVYTCEIYDPEVERFISFYYSIDAIPYYAVPSTEEALRCSHTVPVASRSCLSTTTISNARAASSTVRSATIVSFRRFSDVRSDHP